MNKKFLMLVTTALLSVPLVAQCRPSSSYSRSSGSMGSSISRSAPTISRSVSSFGNSSASSRSTMSGMGSKTVSGWFSNRAASQESAPKKDYTARSEPSYNNRRQQDHYYSHSQPSGNVYSPPTYAQAPSNSGTGSFIGSMAGSYIGSRLANADSDRSHDSGPHYSQNVNPNNDYDVQEDEPVVTAPTTEGQTPEHHSGIIWKLLFFSLLVGGSGAWWWYLFYFRNKDIKNSKSDKKEKIKNLILVGQNVTVDNSLLMNDPANTSCPLHFEADSSGVCTIVGVSKTANSYNLYLDTNMNEFINLFMDGKHVEESYFFSYIDMYPLGTQNDVETWMGKDGFIGSPTFTTKDGIRWTREVFPDNDSWIEPEETVEHIVSTKGNKKWKKYSCLYSRETGFSDAFAQKEYLIISLLRGFSNNGSLTIDPDENANAVAFVELWAGVEIPSSSLDLTI